MRTDRRYETEAKTMSREQEKQPFLKTKQGRFALLSVAAALALIVVALSVRNISDNREYKRYYTAGQDYYYAGDYENALGSLRRAYEIEERDDCAVLTADCYTAMGNYEKALEILRSLDVKDANVSTRIEKINALMSEKENDGIVIVAGQSYPVATKVVILNDRGLDDRIFDELTQLYALDNIALADNMISSIAPISAFGGLITLDLSRNNVSDIRPLSALSSLRTLYLDGNPVTDLTPLYELKNLATLSIKGIKISEEQLAELSRALPDCAIHCEEASSDVFEITLGGVTFKSDVTELNLSGLSLRDISALSNCKSLKKLLLRDNNITDLSPLMDIPNLSYLDISNNSIIDLRPLMGIQRLTYLDVSNNDVTSTVALGNLVNLYELYLDNNPLNDFSGLKKLRALGTLGLSNTGASDDALGYLAGLSSLVSLDIRDNPALSGEAVDSLKHSLTQCTIYHSELSYNVLIGGRQFKNSDTVIDLSSLGISDISQVTSFLHPEQINLANNSISNIFNIQYCTPLKTLNLAGNLIEDISPIAPLTQLENLDLSNNFISNVASLYNLRRLRSLNLSGNPLTEEQIEELREQLPDCTIYF